MNKIINFYHKYYSELTWFFIGCLISTGIDFWLASDAIGTVVNFGLAWINYHFWKQHNG